MKLLIRAALLHPQTLPQTDRCQDCGSSEACSGLCADCYESRADHASHLNSEIYLLERDLAGRPESDPRRQPLLAELHQLQAELRAL